MARKQSSQLPVVRIADPTREGHTLVINARDFDPAKHRRVGAAAPAATAAPASSGTTAPTPPATGEGAGTEPPAPPAPVTAGGGAPEFLRGITRPVLEAMKYQDLVALAARGGLPGVGRKKDELVAELAQLAGLPAGSEPPAS